jgi:hypothetical protein
MKASVETEAVMSGEEIFLQIPRKILKYLLKGGKQKNANHHVYYRMWDIHFLFVHYTSSF